MPETTGRQRAGKDKEFSRYGRIQEPQGRRDHRRAQRRFGGAALRQADRQYLAGQGQPYRCIGDDSGKGQGSRGRGERSGHPQVGSPLRRGAPPGRSGPGGCPRIRPGGGHIRAGRTAGRTSLPDRGGRAGRSPQSGGYHPHRRMRRGPWGDYPPQKGRGPYLCGGKSQRGRY